MSKADLIKSLQAQMDAISGGAAPQSAALCDETRLRAGQGKRSRSACVKASGSYGQIEPASPSSPISAYPASSLPSPSSASSAPSAFSKIIDLVNASDKSESAIRTRLSQKGFDEMEIDQAVDRAKECGFIDDRRFADVLIRSRIAQGKGSQGIEAELKSHGIDVHDIPEWPFEYGIEESTELERALLLLDKKPPRSKNVRESAFRKLVNKGYSTSVASSAARIWTERSRSFYDDANLA